MGEGVIPFPLGGYMKKLLFLLIIGLIIVSNSHAAQRKISTGIKSTSAQITTVPSIIYDIEIIATAANGYAVIFDSENNDLTGKTELVELREATQYNSKHATLGAEGIKAGKGIYLYLNNATAILYYY